MKSPVTKLSVGLISLLIAYPLVIGLLLLYSGALGGWSVGAILLGLVLGGMGAVWWWRRYHQLHLGIENIHALIAALETARYDQHYLKRGWPFLDETGLALDALARHWGERSAQFSLQTQRLNLLIDHLVIGVMLIDQSGQVRLANQSFYTILGLTEDLEGEHYVKTLPGYQLVAMIEQSFSEGVSLHEEVRLYYPREAILDVNVIYVDASASKGAFDDQVIVLVYDITKIRHLETVRSDFIANASHELKTPVTAIKGFSETLLDGALEEPDTAREFVSIIDQETGRLESLISDILDLAKIEEGSRPYTPEDVEVMGVLKNMVQHMQPVADQAEVTLVLPKTKQWVWVRTERGSLQQILLNLLANAIKYNQRGGHVWLTVAVNPAETQADIAVQDDGIGIPHDDLPRIFERFYRVDKTREAATGGTGLGLSIVRNLVERVGGMITVTSTVGQGTTFTVSLPLIKGE